MAYQVLARKYRPLRFSDVVGQDHVTRTLQNALEQDRIAHGYIFSGHRGIGKTTIARILASALNCRNAIGSAARPTPEPCLQCDSCLEIRQGNAVDVIEIDAATNRGIDEIRELRDAARYRPARDRFKIYILDEAHQITDAAFNALLKTLEEPPDHIVFMMATTEPENIPQTIRSRCQHFSFHAVKFDDILTQLRSICVQESVTANDAALALLAEAGDGSMRDALSIMDQAIASAPTLSSGAPELSEQEIRDLMGSVPNTVFEQVLEAVSQNDAADVLITVNRLLDAGNSPSQIARQFVRYLRNAVVAKIAGVTEESSSSDLLQISPDERRRAARSALLFSEEELTRFLQVMLRTFDDLGFRQEQRFHLELGLLKLVHMQRLLPLEKFLSQLPRPEQTTPQKRSTPPVPPASRSSAPSSSAPPRPLGASPVGDPVPSAAAPVNSVPVVPVQPPAAAVIPAQSPSPAPPDETTAPPRSSPERASEIASVPASIPAFVTPLPVDTDDKVPMHGEDAPPATSTEAAEAAEPVEEVAPTAPLQSAAVEALFAAGKLDSAAEQLQETTWTLAEGEIHIQTRLSKQMIATIFRPEVEAIVRSALRAQGSGGLRLVFLPGVADVDAAKKPRSPRTGSAEARALQHPTVQAAQKLFGAEVTNVFDLRRD